MKGKAKPIWIENKEQEMNVHAVFRVRSILTKDTVLHIAGTAFYRVYVNGRFVGFGPARTAEGYLREDVLSLGMYVTSSLETDEIVIEAMGYYCHSLSSVHQDSCLLYELRQGEKILAYTNEQTEAFLPNCRVQKAERYSFQRYFTEVWDYRGIANFCDEKYRVTVKVLGQELKILERHVPYPMCQKREVGEALHCGIYKFEETLPYFETKYSGKIIPKYWGTFEWNDIPYHPFSWIQRQKQTITQDNVQIPVILHKGEYAILDFGRIETGFLLSEIFSFEESDVVIGYSEFYQGEDFKFTEMNVHNVLEYLFEADRLNRVESFEPYVYRYAIVMVKEGSIRLQSFGVRTYMYDTREIKLPKCENNVQEAIARAAVRTFAHNTVDIYMDCPSRERAGWLCDSYFTARTEYYLTGQSLVEEAFLENYRLFENKGKIHEGALPECYPADIPPGRKFIPQWTMWYVLQVEEYLLKRGHKEEKEAFRETIYNLLDFYKKYENEDGLLERLPSWNFVEWSKANEWTWDVNYPTNFLYARVLEAIYNIYGDIECAKKSCEVRETSVEQSFNGRYFLDHAVRNFQGNLIVQPESSEACQYYAVLFAGIDIDSKKYAVLKDLICNIFSPERKGAMPEIMEVNAFIGAYLRMDALLKMGKYELVLKDIEGFFGQMEAYTGTLWEYRQFKGSYDHGFASYVLVVMDEAIRQKAGGKKS